MVVLIRKPPNSLKWVLFIGTVFLVIMTIWFVLEVLPWHEEFHNKPPQNLFQEVMGVSVPPGVSNLRVAARGYVIKRWVWMRFQATDKAIAALPKGDMIIDPYGIQEALRGKGWVANSKYNVIDMKAVGWQDVLAVDSPEVYELSHGSAAEPFIWLGEMIVDRKNHTVYIHMGGD